MGLLSNELITEDLGGRIFHRGKINKTRSFGGSMAYSVIRRDGFHKQRRDFTNANKA